MKRANIPIQKFKDAPIEIIDGDRGNNYPKDSEWLENGYCLFLNTGNVTESGFNFNNCQFISFDKDQIMRKGKLKRNDLVMTTRGTVGNVGYYNSKIAFENIRINSGMVIFRVDQVEILPSFLYQYLRSKYFNKQVNALRTGAAQPQLPIRDIKCIKIQIPQIVAQEKIADILSAYDDLIDINRRRIQLLEESARLLFREWFVYFRFPRLRQGYGGQVGHEEVKIVNGVPEGWKKGNIHDISEVKSGYAFNSKDWLDKGNPVIKIGNIIGDGTINLDDCSYIDQSVASKAKSFTLKKGDLLIAMTGATIGKVGLLSENEKIAYLNQRVGKFIPKFEGAELILYCFFMGNTAQNYITNYAGGAAQANISASQIESIKILVAPQDIYNQFISLIEPMFEEILNLRNQNQKLAQARDLLLPRLMSGEIGV